MTSVRSAGQSPVRWAKLAVVSPGIIVVTLNWSALATAFPLTGTEFKARVAELPHLAIHRLLRAHAHPRRDARPPCGDQHDDDIVLGLLVQGRPELIAGRSRLGSRLLGEYGAKFSSRPHIRTHRGQATYGNGLTRK